MAATSAPLQENTLNLMEVLLTWMIEWNKM